MIIAWNFHTQRKFMLSFTFMKNSILLVIFNFRVFSTLSSVVLSIYMNIWNICMQNHDITYIVDALI